MRKTVCDYVAMLHEHEISNPADTKQWDQYPIIRRVFNNGSFNNGGRFYGGNWLSCKRQLRPYILIDGEETVEIDYVALHACLAYARKKIGWWESVEKCHYLLQDPYVMMGKLTESEWRLFYKKGLNIALSASSKLTTTRALRQLLWKDAKAGKREYPLEIGNSTVLTRELDKFLGEKGRHSIIADLFYTGVGLELQYLDSQIAEEIYQTFTAKGKPVLGIHDSFLVKKSDAPLLEETMFTAYRNKVGFTPRFK